MAIKFKQSFANQAQAISEYAKTNKYYDASVLGNLSQEDALTFQQMWAETRNKNIESFNTVQYQTLKDKDKLAYYYNEYFQDRNETVIDDDGNTVNVYEERKKYLDAAYEYAAWNKAYSNMNIAEKILFSGLGLLANVGASVTEILEGWIDAGSFVAEGAARLFGNDAAGDRIREFTKKDITGARSFRAAVDRYMKPITSDDPIYNVVNQVASSITQMVPLTLNIALPGLGTFLYYTSAMGNAANQAISANPDINYGSLFAYTAGTTAFEALSEGLSSAFGAETIVDTFFKASKGVTSYTKPAVKTILKEIGVEIGAEAAEEMFSEFFGGLLYRQFIDPTAPAVSISDIFNAGLIGGLTGGIMHGGTISRTKNLVVDKSGKLRTIKDIKLEADKKGVKTNTLIGKKLSKYSSFKLNQAFDSLNRIDATNIADLKQRTGLSEEALSTNEKYKKDYEYAKNRDEYITQTKQESALALSKYLEVIGVEHFKNAVKLLDESSAKAKELVDNFNQIRSGEKEVHAKYAQAFSQVNNGAVIRINDSPSDEFRALARQIKADYGVEVLNGTVGEMNGNAVQPITAVDGAILVDENLLKTMSVTQLFDTIIKKQLVSAALTENTWLNNKEVGKILKDVLPEGIDTSKPITENVKETIIQQLLFDDVAIENVFLQDKNIFIRFGRWIQNRIKDIKTKTKTKAKKIEFNHLLKTRDKYIKSISNNIGNEQDANKASKIFEMSDDEIVNKLLNVMQTDKFNEHIALMDINLDKSTIQRIRAVKYLKSALKTTSLTQDGEIDWSKIEDPSNYKDDFVEKLSKKYKDFSFQDALYEEIFMTYNMVLSVKNKTLFRPLNLVSKTKKGFMNTLDAYVESGEGLDILKRYDSIQSIFGTFLNKYFSEEQLSNITITYTKDLSSKGRIEIRPDNTILININASMPDSMYEAVLHEVGHAIAHLQGLPDGITLAAARDVSKNTNNTMLRALGSQMFTREFMATASRESLEEAVAYQLYYQSYGEAYARGDIDRFVSTDGFEILNGRIFGRGRYKMFTARIATNLADMAVEKVDSTEDTKTVTRTKADGTVVTETVKKSTGKGDAKEKKNVTPTEIRQSLEGKYNKNAESMRKAGYSTEFINDFLDSSINKPVTFYTDKIDDAVGKIATTNEDLRDLQSGKPISIYDEKLKKRIFKPWSELTEEQQNAEKARISRQAGNNQIGSVDAINDLISICYPNNQNIKDITSILREITRASTGSGEKIGMVFSEGSVMKTGVSPLILALTYSKLKSTILTGDFSWLESLYAPTTLKKGEELSKVLKREGLEDSEIKLLIEQYEADVREAKERIKKLFDEYKNIFESENKDMKLTVPHMVSVLLGDVDFDTKTYKLNEDKYNALAPLLIHINTLLQDKQNPKRELIKKLLSEDFTRTYETSKKMFAALQKGLLYELSVGEGAVKGKKGQGETSFIERASSDEDVSFEESDTDELAETEESVDYDEDSAFEALLKSEDLENRKKGLKKTSFGEDKMIKAISKNSQKVTEWLESPQKENVGIAKYFSNVLGFKAALNRKDVSEAVKEEIKTQASLDEFVRVIDEYIDNIDVSQPGAEDLFYNIYTKLDAQRNNIAVAFGKTAWDDVVKHHVPNQRKKGYNYSAKELLDKVHNKRKGDVRKTIKETAPKSEESIIESQPKTKVNEEKIVEKKPVEEKTQQTEVSENNVDSTGNELSKEQQEFFKDSKIRDKYGRLLKLYHGSPASDIISFEFSDDAPNNFFTTSKPYAEQYINDIDTGEPNGKIYEVYLNVKNPFNAIDPKNAELAKKILGRVPTKRTVSDTDKIYKYLRTHKTEFDGIVAGEELSDKMIAEYGKNANTSFVPLYPEQIKLVENTDPKNSDSIYDFDEEQLYKDYLDERQKEKTEKKKQEIKSLKEELTTLESKTEQKKRLEEKSKELLNKRKKQGFDGDSLGEFDKSDLNKIVKSEIASEKASIEEKIKNIEEEIAPDEISEVVKEETLKQEKPKEKTKSVARTPEQERLIKGIANKEYRTNPDNILYEKDYSRAIGYSEDADTEYGVRSYFVFESVKESILADIQTEEDIELILDAILNDEIPMFEAHSFLLWLATREYIFHTEPRIVEKYDLLVKEYIGTAGSILANQRWVLAPHTQISQTLSDATKGIKEKFSFSEEFINKNLPELNNIEGRVKELRDEITSLKEELSREKDSYRKTIKELELKNKELELKLTASNNQVGLLEHKLKQKNESETEVTKNIEEAAKICEEVGFEIAKFVEKHKPLEAKEKAYINLTSWRYLSMLSNPATWGKNYITNTLVTANETVVDLCGKVIYKFSEKHRAEYIKQVGYYGDYDESFKKLVEELFYAKIKANVMGSRYTDRSDKASQIKYAKERAAQAKNKTMVKIEEFIYDKALSDERWIVPRALRNAAGMLAGSRELLLQEVMSYLSAKYRVPYIDGKLDPEGIINKVRDTNKELADRLSSAMSGNLNETLLLANEITPKGLLSQIINKAGERSNKLLFKADTAFSKFVQKTSQEHPAIGMVISAFIPFARSVINIGLYAIDHSPIGIAKGVARWMKYKTNIVTDMRKEIVEYYHDQYTSAVNAAKKTDPKFKPEDFDSWVENNKDLDELDKLVILADGKKIKHYNKTVTDLYNKLYEERLVRGNTIGMSDLFGSGESSELVTQGVVGTGALIAGLIINALFDIFDIDDDEDYLGPVLKIKLFGESIKISLDSLSPSSTMFSMGAILTSNRSDKFADMFELMVNQTLLSTFESGLKYNDSTLGWFENQAINYVQQYIPGILKPMTKIIDRSKKDKSGNFINKLWKTTLSNLPGLSYIVGDKINPYTGEKEKHFNTFIGSLIGAYSPIVIRSRKKSPLEEDAVVLGAETKGLSGSFIYNDKSYKVSDKYKTEMAKYRANYITKEYAAISSDKKLVTVENENGKRITTKWSKLTDKQKKTVMERIYSEASSETKIKYWITIGNTYKTNNTIEYNKYRKLFGTNVQYDANWSKSKFVER